MSEELLSAVASLGLPEVGRSTEGRPLWAGSFGAGTRRPLLIVAGVHGDEPSSVAAALELVGWLSAHPSTDGPVWIMPVMNPDGIARGTKNSARDVDLNRNFPARNFTTTHGPGYFPGDRPLSEPETAALAALVAALAVEAVVAVHAPFACINYDGPARAWAEAVARATGWPARADIGYPTPGSLGSWLGGDHGLPVLTIELPPGPHASFRAEAQAALQTATHREGIR